jgi:hypothetical protein
MKIRIFALAVLMVVLAGCGTIKNYEQLAQPTGKDLATYIGGTIFKVNRSSDLPNQFGRADLFGGKVFAGYTELRYQGMTGDGSLILRVTEVAAHSTETTMSRYEQSSGSLSVLPPNTTDVVFDATKEKELVVAGIRVLFIEFTPQTLRYRLQITP